jgi:uncharacterized protein YqjF (DUF2071 family)
VNRSPQPKALSPACSDPIERGWLRNDWHELTFLHWPYDPEVVQALLPAGLTVDVHDGQAWVSLVPFQMRRAGPTWLPSIPYLSNFWETNVRTYVVDSMGNRAVWFLSLDCVRLPVVAFARWTIGFPYYWAAMDVEIAGRRRRYTTTGRRWPRRPAASTVVSVDVGDQIEPTELDVFLTARWGTVAKTLGGLWFHAVDHEPWTLHDASVAELSDTAMAAPGLPAPSGDPIVRWAQPVHARFARPVRV